MEYVRGQPITDFAAAARLPLRAQIELLARVCDAVEHAHECGVIHRDLKPSNILVDPSGQPKILDFGVARLVEAGVHTTGVCTETGQLLGTVPYMSPEQLVANPATLDARSDVYALGVICFELLAGRRPHDLAGRSLIDAARVIQERAPLRLGSVNRVFRGDLETILGKALEKDKSRRYGSAAELATDLRRYLDNRPIRARPPTAAYRLRKLVARHKALTTMVAILFAALLGFGASMSVLYARAERNLSLARVAEQKADAEARRARTEAQTVQRVSDFLVGLFEVGDRRVAANRGLTLQEVFERGATRIQTELHDEPLVRGRVLVTLGRVFRSAPGLDERAVELAREAVEIFRRLLGADDLATAESLSLLGAALSHAGDYDGAESAFRESLAIRSRRLGERDESVAQALADVGLALENQGQLEESARLMRDALQQFEQLPAVPPETRAGVQSDLAQVLGKLARDAEAEALYRSALDFMRASPAAEPTRLANTLNSYGTLLSRTGNFPQAEAALREALAIFSGLYGAADPELLTPKSNLARLLERRGDSAGAVALLREVLDGRRKSLPADHPLLAGSLNNLGFSLAATQDFTGAAEVLREALAIRRKILAPDHPDLATALHNLGWALQNLGQDEAEPLLRESLAIRRRKFGESNPGVARVLHHLGMWRLRRGDAGEARMLLEQAVAIRRQVGPRDDLARALVDLADSCQRQGELLWAASCSETALALYRQTPGLRSAASAWGREDLGRLARGRGDDALAETCFCECWEVRLLALEPGDWRIATARGALGEILARQGRFADAEALLVPACERLLTSARVPVERQREVVEALAGVYDAIGRTEKAAACRARLGASGAASATGGG